MLVRVLLILALVLPLPLSAQEVKTESTGLGGPPSPAQEVKTERPRQVYKLDYVIAELEGGKRVEARDYTLLLKDESQSSIRVGNRVPIAVGDRSFQYTDIGVNIDALTGRPLSETAVEVRTTVEVTAVVMGGGQMEKLASAPGQFVTRNFKTYNTVVIPFGKPMVLFTLDEPNSKRSFQIQVTATLVR